MANVYVPIGELFNVEKGELQSTKCTPGDYNFITAAEEWKTHNEYDHECEALIFAAAASGSLGRTHYVNGKFITSDLCYILTPKNEKYPLNIAFYHFIFNSLRKMLVAATKSGTSKESINQKNYKKYELPYFDIEQQELWIDRLRNTQTKKSILEDEITHQQNLLKKLRQSILQEAIEGKLTADWRKQNPDVEPASELLKRIQVEKEQLIKAKKIKKQKPLPPISEEEKPFELPKGWEWCRLGDLVESYQNGISKRTGSNGLPVVVLRLADIENYEISLASPREIVLNEREQAKYCLRNSDILITRVNGSVDIVGNFNSCNGIQYPIAYCDHFIRMRLASDGDLTAYISIVEKTNLIRERVKAEFKTTSGQKTINQGHISNYLVPLPPHAEQKAIVTKVEKLLSLCGELEQQITTAKTHSEQLMQAVLKEAFQSDVSLG